MHADTGSCTDTDKILPSCMVRYLSPAKRTATAWLPGQPDTDHSIHTVTPPSPHPMWVNTSKHLPLCFSSSCCSNLCTANFVSVLHVIFMQILGLAQTRAKYYHPVGYDIYFQLNGQPLHGCLDSLILITQSTQSHPPPPPTPGELIHRNISPFALVLVAQTCVLPVLPSKTANLSLGVKCVNWAMTFSTLTVYESINAAWIRSMMPCTFQPHMYGCLSSLIAHSPSFLAQPKFPSVSGCFRLQAYSLSREDIDQTLHYNLLIIFNQFYQGGARKVPWSRRSMGQHTGYSVNISSPTDHRKSIWSRIGHYKVAALYKAAAPSKHPPPPPNPATPGGRWGGGRQGSFITSSVGGWPFGAISGACIWAKSAPWANMGNSAPRANMGGQATFDWECAEKHSVIYYCSFLRLV